MTDCDRDILIPIADNELPELKNKYENIDKFPEVVSLINSGIRLKKNPETRNVIKFFSPNNCWKEDGTFIALMEYHFNYIFFTSLDKTGANLYKGLLKTNRIKCDPFLRFYSIDEDFFELLHRFLEKEQLSITMEVPCYKYKIEKEKALKFSEDCLSDFTIKSLTPAHSSLINDIWPHKHEDSEKYIESIIRIHGGVGLFENTTNELVCWILKGCLGHLINLQTVDAYQRKGFGKIVTKYLSKMIAKDGSEPYGTLVLKNEKSIAMFEQLGFRNCGLSTFILCIKQ